MIRVSGSGVELRVPIRRCLLGEQMARLLMQTEEGRLVCARLLINNSPEALAAPALRKADNENIIIRMAFGPDLEPIHPLECTTDRCEESCAPSFKAILIEFGLRDAAEAQVGNIGCEINSEESYSGS